MTAELQVAASGLRSNPEAWAAHAEAVYIKASTAYCAEATEWDNADMTQAVYAYLGAKQSAPRIVGADGFKPGAAHKYNASGGRAARLSRANRMAMKSRAWNPLK